MSKLLAIVALAFCFSNAKADVSQQEPFKALGSTVVTLGYDTPVALTQAAWNNVKANGENLNLIRLLAADHTKCLMSVDQPLAIPACTIEMSGKFVTALWSTAGFFVADAAEIALNGVTNIIGAWARAFDACYANLKNTVAAPVAYGCKVISFVLDTAGTIIKVAGNIVLGAARAVIAGVQTVLQNLFALPVALLRGDIQAAFQALFNVVRGLVTCVVPLVPVVLAILGKDLSICTGKKAKSAPAM